MKHGDFIYNTVMNTFEKRHKTKECNKKSNSGVEILNIQVSPGRVKEHACRKRLAAMCQDGTAIHAIGRRFAMSHSKSVDKIAIDGPLHEWSQL